MPNIPNTAVPVAPSCTGFVYERYCTQYSAHLNRAVSRPVASDQDGLGGASWVCSVLRGMDLPCHTHTFYDRPAARSGLRTRYCIYMHFAWLLLLFLCSRRYHRPDR